MIDLRKVHEREVFDLVGLGELSLSEVQPALKARGFVFTDDFASLKRSDNVERWQTRTLVQCDFLAAGREVYPDESSFDLLRFSILVASMPEEQVVKALDVVFDVAGQLRVGVTHNSVAVSRADIPSLVTRWTAEILQETGDVCGSDSVAILISMEYNKGRT